MVERITGGCLCGEVSFSLTGPFDAFHWCHCSRCRKDTGSAHASNLFTHPDRIKWLSGKGLVKRFELPQAERYAKAFCSHCGSPLPYPTRDGKTLVVPAGSLDSDPGVSPRDNLHWRSRAPWYEAGLAAPRYEQDPE